jgi:hypothetical protein
MMKLVFLITPYSLNVVSMLSKKMGIEDASFFSEKKNYRTKPII